MLSQAELADSTAAVAESDSPPPPSALKRTGSAPLDAPDTKKSHALEHAVWPDPDPEIGVSELAAGGAVLPAAVRVDDVRSVCLP